MSKLPRTYTVSVPTKTYLRKYFYAKYGKPFHLNYNTNIGTILLCLLDRKVIDLKISAKRSDQRIANLTDEIKFTASMSTLDYKGFSLSPAKIIAITRYLEKTFVEDLYFFCRVRTKERSWRPGTDQAIYVFADMYGIDLTSDITFDALKQAHYRYRKKNEKILVTFVTQQRGPLSMGFSDFFSFS